MPDYKLDENVNESFPFEVGGHKYEMRYPTLAEIREISAIFKDKKEDDDKVEEKLFTYITAKSEGAPPISKALEKQNVKVLANFNKMIIAELELG